MGWLLILGVYDVEILLTIGFFHLRFFLKKISIGFLAVFFVAKLNDVLYDVYIYLLTIVLKY